MLFTAVSKRVGNSITCRKIAAFVGLYPTSSLSAGFHGVGRLWLTLKRNRRLPVVSLGVARSPAFAFGFVVLRPLDPPRFVAPM